MYPNSTTNEGLITLEHNPGNQIKCNISLNA